MSDVALRIAAPTAAGGVVGRAGIVAEILDRGRAAALRDDWLDLLGRCDLPNVFMDPVMFAAADPGAEWRALAAFRPLSGRRELIGFWLLGLGRPRRSGLPVLVLNAPADQYGYLASPILDRTHAAAALNAMLDRISAEPALPKIVALDMMPSGAVRAVLDRVLAARGTHPLQLELRRRPLLNASSVGGTAALDLSASTRKKLRQHRRRLAERHDLRYTIATDPAAVAGEVDAFLAMEAAGWKGRAGTALAADPAAAGFVRQAMTTLASQGAASVHSLRADGKPVSVQLMLRCGAAAYTWKTAFDETYADYSPGVLLLEDYTAHLLADPALAFVDSCSFDETGMMAAWSGRQEVADIWIDVRRAGSLQFALLAKIQIAVRAARDLAKRARAKLRRMPRRWRP
ncbi:MAG: GNAT family N-acetyltransferase [Bauldia sp.]